MAAKVVSKQCPNCGAPIRLQQGVRDQQCQFCGNVIHIEWNQKAPPKEKAQPLTLYVKPSMPTPIVWVIVLTSLLPILIPIFIFLGPQLSTVAATAAQSAGIETVNFPATCGMNDELVIMGRTFSGTGTLITGEVNCKIRIVDSKLSGDVVVHAKNLVELTLENSTIEGKEAAVVVDMNSKIFAKKNSVIKGAEAGIVAELNTEVTLEDSKIESDEAGIRGDSNFVLRGTRSEISGRDHALKVGSNPKVIGKQLVLKGNRVAVLAQYNLEVELKGGGIEGGEIGIKADANPKLALSDKARIIAKESAIEAESNLALELEDAIIDGGDYGVATGVNAKLKLENGGKIRGGRVGVKADSNLEVSMRSALIESEQVGICSTYNAEIETRQSKIAGIDALRFQRQPNVLELEDTQVSGEKRFNAQGCNLSRAAR